MRLIIVKRAHTEIFERLVRTFADDPNIKVVWERRIDQRRLRAKPQSPERRARERRRLLKSSNGRDYVVVHTAEDLPDKSSRSKAK